MKIKPEYIGSKVKDGSKEWILSNDMDYDTKMYIFNRINKGIFELNVPKKNIKVDNFDKPIKKEENND